MGFFRAAWLRAKLQGAGTDRQTFLMLWLLRLLARCGWAAFPAGLHLSECMGIMPGVFTTGVLGCLKVMHINPRMRVAIVAIAGMDAQQSSYSRVQAANFL